MDVGLSKKDGADYLDFVGIKRIYKNIKKIGDKYEWFWVLTDRQDTDHWCSVDQYDISFVLE